MLVYTSITKSYLPKARVLAKSVKYFHPNWTFILLYSDSLPDNFDLTQEPFDDVLTIDQLGLSDWKSWAFGHTVVELCTAVKGIAAELFSKKPEVDKIMYLDPDIKVFNSLLSLELLLDEHDILLTPHLLDAEKDLTAIQDNEISALKHGVYNLGFFAAKTSGQGLDFIQWWAKRLCYFCRDDIPGGLFTDQRWCDLAPAFFSSLGIVRDRGCNVASWNIAHRPVSRSDTGEILAAGVPLRFYHFTSYDNGNGMGMLMKYAPKQSVAHEIWAQYAKDLVAEGQGASHFQGWKYSQFENEEPIPLAARRTYLSRQDIRKIFPDPYSTGEHSYLSWWKKNIAKGTSIKNNMDNFKSKSVTEQILKVIYSPRISINILKSIINIVKCEGFSGLIQRIYKYKG